jgi:hypothetical protein
VLRKSRLIGALGLTLALGVSGLAFGVGTDNNPEVVGQISPSKLSKKQYKPVNLSTGLRNDPAFVTGTQSNPASEEISFGKNIRFKLNRADFCSAPFTNGSTPAQARAACPAGSYIGSGSAVVTRPPGTGAPIADLIVSVFNGPTNGKLRLHVYSPTLGAASPGAINGNIVSSNQGSKYGKMLTVPATPETGSLLITTFLATINKSSKVVEARCKSKKTPFLRKVTYKDGTSETATLTQKCKQKKK